MAAGSGFTLTHVHVRFCSLPLCPSAGEDDYRVCLANGVIQKGEGIPCPLDDDGRFVDPVTDFAGMYVKVRPWNCSGTA